MIAGLCESPLTFQAIIIWRDELNEGKVFLRDIIDLEATYAGPDAVKGMANPTRPAFPASRASPARCRPRPRPAPMLGGPALVAAPPSAPPAATPFRPAGYRPPTPQGFRQNGSNGTNGTAAEEGEEARRSARRSSTTTRWRTRCRSPRSRPSSSRR